MGRSPYNVDMISTQGRHDWVINRVLIGIAATVGIAACLGDLYMTHLLATWYPGYKPLLQPMSDLGHEGSPVERITSTWWVIMGLMFMVFGYGFHQAYRHYGKPAKAAAWMLALYGIGEGLGSGLISGTPGKTFQTASSIFHNLLGAAGIMAAILLPFIMMKIYNARRSSAFYLYSWFTSVAAIFFLALFLIANVYHPEGSWITYLGLWQRLVMLLYYIYFLCLGVLMLVRKNSVKI